MIIMDIQSLVKSFEKIKNKSENLRKKIEKEQEYEIIKALEKIKSNMIEQLKELGVEV